eukprot:scaffold4731_cov144-Isochrysis_galbana.AAC.2
MAQRLYRGVLQTRAQLSSLLCGFERDHNRAYVDGDVAVRPRPSPRLCRSAHLSSLLILARSLWRRWHAQKVARQGRRVLGGTMLTRREKS